MFIDNQWKKDRKTEGSDSSAELSHDHKSAIFAFIGFALFLVLVIVGVFLLVKIFVANPQRPPADPSSSGNKGTSSRRLPEFNPSNGNNSQGPSQATTSLQAEDLQFGNFYNPPSYDYDMATSSSGYELPIQVKTQVSNFYNFNRKISLDKKVEELNSQGFTIISNPFSGETNDFYSVYRKLQNEKLPILLTKDFLNYHYQNILKKNFKRIESNMFYENLWNINKTLYERSKLRYEKLLEEEGLSNDPYVQGARMEMAYFAVALKLLEPRDDQFSETKLDSKNKFSPKEERKFSIDLPYYLEDDVPKEVRFILRSDEKKQSPVLFYKRNYKDFRIPGNYKDNERLVNVYLTSKWLNSLLPLYYQNPSCPDCKVDKADWRISTMASLFIAHDFQQEQSIKNDWAQIYKVVAYFKGLRDELTYLKYTKELQNILEEDYDLKESFFGKKLSELDDKLLFFREKIISNFDFTEIEGAHDHTATSSRPHIGLRILSRPYVPDEYIYEQLTRPQIGLFSGRDGKYLKSLCEIRHKEYRCKAINLDVPNLIQPIPQESDQDYFTRNTNYKNYDSQVEKLREQLSLFDDYAWHDSNYWNTFYVYKRVLEHINPENPMLATPAWTRRNIESMQAALVGTQVSTDKLQLFSKEKKL